MFKLFGHIHQIPNSAKGWKFNVISLLQVEFDFNVIGNLDVKAIQSFKFRKGYVIFEKIRYLTFLLSRWVV